MEKFIERPVARKVVYRVDIPWPSPSIQFMEIRTHISEQGVACQVLKIHRGDVLIIKDGRLEVISPDELHRKYETDASPAKLSTVVDKPAPWYEEPGIKGWCPKCQEWQRPLEHCNGCGVCDHPMLDPRKGKE